MTKGSRSRKTLRVFPSKKIILVMGILFLILIIPMEVVAVGNITGVIYQQDGKTPVPGAEVSLIASEGISPESQITGMSGSFRFMNIPAGKYIFRVRAIGYREMSQEITIRIGRDTRRLDCQLESVIPGGVKGRIFREDNFTLLSGVTILVYGATGSLPPVVTNEEGLYQLTNLIPGEYHLKAKLSGYREQELVVTVEEGKVTSEIDFYLPEIPVALNWGNLLFWKKPGETISLPLFLCKINRIKVTIYRVNLFSDLGSETSWREIFNRDFPTEKVIREWEEEIAGSQVLDGVQHSVTLSNLEKGIYLLETRGNDKKSRCLLVVSPLTVLVKVSPRKIMTYVFDNRAEIPLRGAAVGIYDEQGLVGQGETDAEGIFTSYILRPGAGEGIVVVKASEDEGLTTFGFTVPLEGEIFLYPSQLFYLTDQSVPFVGILRGKDGSVLSKRPVTVRIKDSTGKVVYQNQLSSDELGIFQDCYFPQSPVPPGSYWLEAEADNITGKTSLEMLSYSSSLGHLKILGGEQYLQGENISIPLELMDGNGDPLAKKAIGYKIYQKTAEGKWDFWQEGKVVTDAQGKAEVNLFPPEVEKEEQFLMVVTAALGGAEIKENFSWKVLSGIYRLQIQGDCRLYLRGEKVSLKFLVTEGEGRPVSTKLRVRWFRKEAEREIIVQEGDITPAAEGEISLIPPREGYYRCSLSYLDPRGGWLQEDSFFVVTSKNYQDNLFPVKEIEIITDRDFYHPGEKVRLLINAPVEKSYLWITVMSDEILDYRLVPLTGGSYYWEFPLLSEYSPQIYIQAHLIRGGEIQYCTRSVKILAPESRLQVNLRTDQPEFRPGERIKVYVSLEDFSAQKCSGEIWLNLLSSTQLSSPTVEDSFFSRIPEVKTYVYDRMIEEMDRAQEEVFPLYQRSAYWEPVFWVGEGEERILSLPTPQETGTWYLFAQAVGVRGAVGEEVLKIISSKKLYLELISSSRLVSGEEAMLTVILHNEWPVSQVVTLLVSGEGIEFVDNITRRIVLPPQSTTTCDFKVRIVDSQKVKFNAQVSTLREADEKEIIIPVF